MRIRINIDRDEDEDRFNQKIKLAGFNLRFRFQWVVRTQSWYVDVEEVNGEPISLGNRATLRFPMFYNVVSNDILPPGAFMFFRVERSNNREKFGDGERIGRDELGKSVRLFYLTHEESVEFDYGDIKRVTKL